MTARRTKPDFVKFIGRLVETVYAQAEKIHLVLDNLNTHFRSSFIEVLGAEQAGVFLARVEFHYTPKHASWLNMAEIEIGLLGRTCLDRRIGSVGEFTNEVKAYLARKNEESNSINWQFTNEKARIKLKSLYPTI